jgi:hemoglobin
MKRFVLTIALVMGLAGCGNGQHADRDFHTSGSREADQRAEQRIAKVQQLRGEGEKGKTTITGENAKPSLFERLGGETGVRAIMDDWVKRALADPRVNWERKGIKQGGVLGIGGKEAEWKPSPRNVEQLAKHLTQFVATATGGPAHYDGRDMKSSHASMKITNAEFDAAVGDLKASLDAARIAIDEQKELLAIIESTRPQIVTERGD